MAIFYEHIKGCNPNNTAMTWIKWSTEASMNDNTEMYKSKHLPNIMVGESFQNFWDLGRIITSQATDQSINEAFTFNKQVTFVSNILLEYDTSKYYTISTRGQGEFDFEGARQITITTTQENDNFIEFDTSLFKTQNIEATKLIKTPEGNIATLKGTTIDISGKCQASYFNATSDARAKINITPTQFSALTVVNSIPTYTFNYIDKPNDTVLGLIAQEAANYNLDGFNMVDNLTASGEDGDYMQMKESKLVYVLWKAVQELTDEVNSLKAQIQQLENK